MGEKFRSSRASAAAFFGGALLVGWICKHAERGSNAAPAAAKSAVSVASIAAPFPEQPEDLDVRIWLAEALSEADAPRLAEIAAKLAAVPDLDDKAWYGLFSCWFATDPAAAWDFVEDRVPLQGIALEEWAALDPAAARAAVEAPSTDQWPQLIRGAARKDSAAAFQLLSEALDAGLEIIPDNFDSIEALGLEGRHLADLARSDPQLAVKWVERLEQPSTFFGAVVYGWHESAPHDALAWLDQRPDRDKILFDLANYVDGFGVPYRSALTDLLVDALPAGNERLEALHHVLEALSYVDPDLAAKEAARVFPDPGLRAEAIGKIASIVSHTDFDKAWEILDQLDPSAQEIRRVNLPSVELSDGTGTSSVNALSSYELNLASSMRGLVSPADIRSELLGDLIDIDKEAALRMMEKIPAADLLRIVGPAFETWQQRDPEEAVRWLAAKLGDQGKLDHTEDLLDHDWLDPAAMRDLIGELPDGTVRSALALQAAADLAESDPRAALRFARDSSTAPEVVEEVYQIWAANDVRAAFGHLAADPDAPPSAWARIAGEALREAPEEFARVVMDLADDAARDAAAAKIADFMSRSADPLAAPHWALAIRGESERQAALEAVFNRLGGDLRLARDEGTAESLRDLIASSTALPDAEKALWLKRIDLEFMPP